LKLEIDKVRECDRGKGNLASPDTRSGGSKTSGGVAVVLIRISAGKAGAVEVEVEVEVEVGEPKRGKLVAKNVVIERKLARMERSVCGPNRPTLWTFKKNFRPARVERLRCCVDKDEELRGQRLHRAGAAVLRRERRRTAVPGSNSDRLARPRASSAIV